MLTRIKLFLSKNINFAIETTLATKSYVNLVKQAQAKNYEVTLLFFWLNSQELAIKRVQTRVAEGGHNIPEDVIIRRYTNGLNNFFNLYKSVVNNWMLIDNSGESYEVIARGLDNKEDILNNDIWKTLKNNYENNT